MIGAIANPTKKVTIEFPISRVKDAVLNIPKVYKKYRLENKDDMFYNYTLGVSEFLSLGAFIDINLNEVSSNKTEINIEVRRKLGAFDNWVEVQNANEHIQKVISALSKAIKSNGVVEEVKEESNWPVVVGFIIGLCILSAMMS